MASNGELKTGDLNFIFKALAQRGKEGKLHKEYNENYTRVFLQLLSFQLNKTGNRVILQAYGSAAEDLKCHERHDLGDMDIMIFPNSDNLTIHEELLEYSLENPLHVRIKGCDHPVLQCCLVEDSGYVATSALKNFHPAIFGSEAPCIVDITNRVFETFLREEFSPIVTGGLSNHYGSPAITLNLSRALAITGEQRKIMQNQALNFPFSLGAADVEWMTSMMCRFKGIDYTRQHAELVKYMMCERDPISHFQKLSVTPHENLDSDEKTGRRRRSIGSQLRNETEHCVTIETNDEHRERDLRNSSLASVPSNDGPYVIATKHCASCDGYQSPLELQSTSSRFTAVSPSLEFSLPSLPKPRASVVTESEGTEKHSEEEVEKNGKQSDLDENQSKVARLSLTQEKEVNSKALPGSSDCAKEEDAQRERERRTRRKRWVDYLLGREVETKRTAILDNESCRQSSPKEQNGSEGLEGSNLGKGIKNGDSIHDKNAPNGEEHQMTKKREENSTDLAHNRDSQEDNESRERERRIQHNLLKHMFGTAKGGQTQKAKVKDTERVESGIDFIPALRSCEWPKVAREWIKRERRWPSPDIVKKVIQEGYHLVVKSPKKNGSPDCDFRISFSHAEYLLSQELNDIQRECYRCLKKYHRAYLCTQPKSLVSFHLKNIFLQTIEETGAEMWTERNRAECMIKLLGNLSEALKRKDLRHFFVKSYNLLGVDYVENPEVLESLAGKVVEIMEDPKRFTTQLIQSREETKQHERPEVHISLENFPRGEPTAFAKTVKCDYQMQPKELSSKSIHDTKHNKKEEVTVSLPPKTVIQRRGSVLEYQYHDLKDLYLDVIKELLHTAFDDADCRLEAMDPLERSLVHNLRELVRSEGFSLEELPGVLESSWQTMGYLRVRLSSEPDMRRRILVAIQGQIEMLKYILEQDDIAVRNEEAVEAVRNRILDPPAENAFDLSHIIPSDIAIQFAQSALFEFFVPRPVEPNLDDDIPLD
ncbi:uncharacterized protein LOC110063385 [Orbicella faveolata]|uniref:uncharacterized protein LOC110063385 n=1 Tax=Orbicella faveolata TaxID=48498 RepID=UPI0009E29BDE|nr:uncharacterized protein LOC110063385 [Orbicella faveolata]